jgi:hypothetical protein
MPPPSQSSMVKITVAIDDTFMEGHSIFYYCFLIQEKNAK